MKKRIFVDTNVLLDVLLEREGFYYDALKIWANAELGKVEACIAAISLNNVHYVMRRLKSETTAMIAVKILMQIFKVVSVDADILRLAVDFHDLFTRNPNHYDNSAIAVVPPSAFVP